MHVLRATVLLGLFLDFSSAKADEKPFRIANRVPWNDSKVVGSPEPMPPFKTVRAFPNLTLRQPLALLPEPGSRRLFILQHFGSWAGPSKLLAARDLESVSETELVLDIKDGLACGFAFHPDYERNGYLFIGMNGAGKTQIRRYTVSRAAPYGIDPNSRMQIIEWGSHGHNGGDVAFGNDGCLYVSTGDGTAGSDPPQTGQRIDDLLASILRIDVDHPDAPKNYSVPKDNPFVDRPKARPEIWAYGVRNPWRMSYDKPSGQLWVGNNGQDLWEQVWLIQKGGNYGWSVSEGSHPFVVKRPAGPDPILPPTAEHSHSEARSLTGGRVYRGERFPDLVGAYVYGDWSTGRVWGIKVEGTKTVWQKLLVDTPFNITGFGTDHAGELYVIDHTAGMFYGLEATTEADKPSQPFPRKLSETSLFANVATHSLHPAAVSFSIRAPQWADGATMERFAAIPGKELIEQRPQLNAGGEWTLPNGSVLAQTLYLDVFDKAKTSPMKRIETRLLTRQHGEWVGYSYKWNDAQTDAELIGDAGAAAEFEVSDKDDPQGYHDQVWRFPSRAECMNCHSRAKGFILSFTTTQLDRDHKYGDITENQLSALEHAGFFKGELPKRNANRRLLVDPYDTKEPLEPRVRSWFHVNCSVCHIQEGGGNANIDLTFDRGTRGMGVVNGEPLHDRFEIEGAKLITPGSPEKSVLYQRVSRRGTGQMPPLVSTEVDKTMTKLIAEWIRGIPKEQK
jgi:glucose/arabinose dehydrogenase